MYTNDKAHNCITEIIAERMKGGLDAFNAVYYTKREVAQLKTPLEARDKIRMALSHIQKDVGCTAEEALTKLKLIVTRL